MKLNSYATSGTSPTESIDFVCENHGSVFLLRPVSPAAISWLSENISDDTQFFGSALAVENRYVWAILVGIQDDGLAVSRG
jgi:hypothetical protein